MSERFFIDTLPLGNQAVLKGDEARHLTRVLRAKIGDAVRLFNGRGSEWPAQVVQIGRDTVSLEIGTACVDRPSDSRLLTVAAALPKGDRQKWMVEKLTELGVGRLSPLATTRGVAEATAGAQARLERGVIEACKQCGRNTLMEVAAGHTLDQLLAAIPAGTYGLIAHPGGSPLNTGALRAATAVLALVGPEGGFTDDELVAADRSGLVSVSLGPHILRVETAAISLAAQF